MATVASHHVHHLGNHHQFFKSFIFSKVAANFHELSRRHVSKPQLGM